MKDHTYRKDNERGRGRGGGATRHLQLVLGVNIQHLTIPNIR